MSTQGIIVILLSVIGFLVISWVTLASMWVKDKFYDHDAQLEEHDDRILALEQNHIVASEQRGEMLEILRGSGGI